MTQETNWIEFEAWMDNISICGYMAEDEADDEKPLYFYKWDGLEGGQNIATTRYPSFDEREMHSWETLVDWFTTTDVVQWLVDNANDKKLLHFRTEDDFGRLYRVDLYINCSKMDEDKSTTIRINQSTKDALNRIGKKGQSYDDIVRELVIFYEMGYD